MKKFALYTFILVAFLCGSSLDTYAGDCVFGGGVVCEDFWKAKAVFVGTVIEGKTVIRKQDGHEWHQRLVRFSIDEAFTGVEGGYGSDSVSYRRDVDERGRFSFKAYEGTTLSVNASRELAPGRLVYSPGVDITVTAGLKPITLVLPDK